MNKIKSHYNLRKFDLPESFNQSDVMIEMHFEYGIINIFPYYNSIEIVETKRELPSLFVTFKGEIEELAFKTLDSLTREDLLNCAFQKSEAIPCCQAIKYEFKDLFYKIVNLTYSDFSKIRIDKENWCYLFKRYLFNNHEYKMLHFQSAKFFIRLTENGNGNLIYEELKSYLAEFLEFEQDSYGLNVNINTINDPMEYGELVKVTAVIVIP